MVPKFVELRRQCRVSGSLPASYHTPIGSSKLIEVYRLHQQYDKQKMTKVCRFKRQGIHLRTLRNSKKSVCNFWCKVGCRSYPSIDSHMHASFNAKHWITANSPRCTLTLPRTGEDQNAPPERCLIRSSRPNMDTRSLFQTLLDCVSRVDVSIHVRR